MNVNDILRAEITSIAFANYAADEEGRRLARAETMLTYFACTLADHDPALSRSLSEFIRSRPTPAGRTPRPYARAPAPAPRLMRPENGGLGAH